MIGSRRAGARYLGVVLASVVALNLYTPLSSASAKAPPARVAPAACACSISLSPAQGPRGTVVTVTGAGFTPSATVNLSFVDAAGVRTVLPTARTGVRGRFVTTVTIANTFAFGHGFFAANTGAPRARGGFLVTRTCSTTAAITLNPTSGKRGSDINVNGTGFCPSTRVRVRLRDSNLTWTTLASSVLVDSQGKFSASGTVPSNAALGDGYVAVKDAASGQNAKKPFTVKP